MSLKRSKVNWIPILSSLGFRRFAVIGAITLGGFALCLGQATELFAQQQSQSVSASTSAEGSWVRSDTVGAGFGGALQSEAKAELTPEFAARLASRPAAPQARAYTENRAHAPGESYVVVDRPCDGGAGGGQPYSPDSSAIHIVEQKDEVLIVRERLGPRHVFMDGRSFPDLSHWDPATTDAEGKVLRLTPDVGFSVGHYDNGVLVVETVGLTPGPASGGGWKTKETHLTERYEVSPDGKHMLLRYTWTDPKIYVTPHTYTYTFDRLEPGSYALDETCDPSDPKEKYSIAPPKQ
jgi:hypothetical protein